MTQEIEIEFKNIVTEADFKKLLAAFSIDNSQFQRQINYYFDTDDFQLKNHHSALRIREKNKKFTLTLKQPNNIGLLETHQQLTKAEAKTVLEDGRLPKGTVASQMEKSLQIDITECLYLGALQTERAEISYLGGTLVFDRSFYLGKEDFEIEYEVSDERQGQSIFKQLLLQYNIPIKKTDNKIKRFFSRKNQN